MKLSLLVKAIPMLAAALLAPLAIFAQTSGEQKTVATPPCGKHFE